MTEVVERNGVVYELEWGTGCNWCADLGAEFNHTPACNSDFCVGNGDEHSCAGEWRPCSGCGSVRRL